MVKLCIYIINFFWQINNVLFTYMYSSTKLGIMTDFVTNSIFNFLNDTVQGKIMTILYCEFMYFSPSIACFVQNLYLPFDLTIYC